MKRGDQHNVSVQSAPDVTYAGELILPDESGIDSPSEKETAGSELHQTPSMGALPVDKPGSSKQKEEWQSTTADESHESADSNADEIEDDEIIATGSGPDPEHAEDN